jgi:hypothetical protein
VGRRAPPSSNTGDCQNNPPPPESKPHYIYPQTHKNTKTQTLCVLCFCGSVLVRNRITNTQKHKNTNALCFVFLWVSFGPKPNYLHTTPNYLHTPRRTANKKGGKKTRSGSAQIRTNLLLSKKQIRSTCCRQINLVEDEESIHKHKL